MNVSFTVNVEFGTTNKVCQIALQIGWWRISYNCSYSCGAIAVTFNFFFSKLDLGGKNDQSKHKEKQTS